MQPLKANPVPVSMPTAETMTPVYIGGGKIRKHLIRLTDEQWQFLRLQYERGGQHVNYRTMAMSAGVSYSTLEKRARKEKWTKTAKIVQDASEQLATQTTAAIAASVDKIALQVAQKLTDDLQPWIEREKRSHIKSAIKRSKQALRRIEALGQDGYETFDKSGKLAHLDCDPKDEMHLAGATERHDNVIRRNLGMNDGETPTRSLNLRILSGNTAVEVTAR